MKNKLLSNILLCFLASTMAFIFIPLYMIGNSPDDFRFIDANIFFKSGVTFSVILGTLLSSIVVLFYLFKLEKIATLFSSFILFWVVVAGLFLPLSISTGMVEPEDNPIDKFNLVLLMVIVTAFSVLSLTDYKKYIKAFVVVVIVTSLIPAVISIHNSDILKSHSHNHPSLSLSNKKNILVISFDGMSGSLITDILKTNKTYAEELKDFIVFDNAVSQSPATAASLMGEMYGIQDYKSKGESVSAAKKTLVDEGLDDNFIVNHVSDSYQYGYGYQIKPMKITNPAIKAQQKVDTFDFFKYPIVRIWTSFGLNFLDWENNVFKIQRYIIKPDTTLKITNKLKNHNGAKWDKKNILTLSLFDSFISDLSADNKEFSIRYMHLTFTHFPIDFDAQCNYKSDDKVWYESHQNEKGMRGQAICSVGIFVDFLQKLKQLEIYNKSLIIFKSDHGKPAYYFSEPPNNLRINKHNDWGYNRYRPTLMIKAFDADKSQITFRTELVLLNDIAKTLCEESGLNIECKKISGVNLLGESLESDEPYYIYVPKNSKSSFEYVDHISIEIPSRKISLLQGMENSPLIELSEPDLSETSENESNFKIHLSDLEKIKTALIKYHDINKKYPISSGFDGLCTKWGKSTTDYIKGLVPNYIKNLPVDPRKSKKCGAGYLYKSNGKDYKFLVHGAPEYDLKRIDKGLIDPARPAWAYGIWSDGANNW